MTKQELAVIVQEYQIENILWFLIGVISYHILKQLFLSNMVAEMMHSFDKKMRNMFDKSEELKELETLIDTNKKLMQINEAVSRQNTELNASILAKSIEIFNQKTTINILENDKKKLISENENLKTKVDNLVEELMKRQSYNRIGMEK